MNNLLSELESLKSNLDNLPIMNLSDLNLNNTDLFIVDINNGFAKGGALYSPRIENLINPIVNFTKSVSNDIKSIIAFTDYHTNKSTELLNYPTHCIENTIECEIVDELKFIENIKIVKKNSTNGFFALDDLSFNNTDNIIIIGDCTDICIYQLAITLKSYFNQNNINKNIIVPINLVDTYNIDNVHPAELLNIVFLNSMIQNGIKVVKEIK
nr:isochorismatase family cysteine hydrolase [uncultured Romboutsia sp.]